MSEQTLIKTIILRTDRENVFRHLTETKLLAKWFHPSTEDWQEGHPFQLVSTERPGEEICWGDVLVMQSPEQLVYSFTHPFLQEHVTTVSITLEECAGGTKLTLVHEGLADGPADGLGMLGSHDKGWDDHFGRLRAIFADQSE